MTKGQLAEWLVDNAKLHVRTAQERINHSGHMNRGVGVIEQAVIDAVVVDFVNFVMGRQGIDLALYTSDLRKP